MVSAPSSNVYWTALARAYALLGQPLKPSVEDIRAMERAANEWRAANPDGPLRALLLGVTPAIASMRWPEPYSLLAVEQSPRMLQAVWPGGRGHAVCGDWRKPPCAPRSRDIVIGDGSINCLPYPEGYQALASAAWNALSERGTFILRFYARPPVRESAEDAADAVHAIPSFHHYKFRLLMALQPDARQGVAVDDVYRFFSRRHPNGAGLPSGPGWEPEAVDMIELYRGTSTVHTFPTLDELRAVLGEWFDEGSVSLPRYPLGERCPTLVMTPRMR